MRLIMRKSGGSILSKGFLLPVFIVALLLSQGCSNRYAEDINDRYGAVKRRLVDLERDINSGRVSNALLIKTYARQLMDKKPELKDVAEALSKDATTEGPIYQSLLDRLNQVNLKPSNKQQYTQSFTELESLWAAGDPVIYNDSLIDVVNTLADLSGGELSRVNIPKEAGTSAAGSVPGSYLVGNPNYGSWQRDSSGNSFWAWYGKYALFSSLIRGFGGPIYYDSWYSRPHYSYYNDYGRSTYGSYSDRRSWNEGSKRLASKGIKTPKPKHYGSVAGQKRVSTYASMRSKSAAGLGIKSSGLGSGRSTATSKRASSFFGSSSRGTASRSYGGK